MLRRLFVLLGLLLLTVGCNDPALLPPELDAVMTPSSAAATPVAVGTLPTQTATLSAPESGRTLRIWLPPGITTDPEMRGGAVLAELLTTFGDLQSDVTLNVQVKNIQGEGGTLNYLRSGRSVGPDILPDLIALPTDLLAETAAEGLIIPLTDLVETDGLYPAAVALGQIDATLYGYPFAFTDLFHLVYNGSVLTEGIVPSWGELVALPRVRLAFAGLGREAGVLALQFYADLGGTLDDQRPHFTFQETPTLEALRRLAGLSERDLLAPGTMTISAADDAWGLFQTGQANLVLVEANRQLARRAQGNRSEFAALPGRSNQSAPVVRGWAWAITTPDPARQALASELIAWLTEPNNMGRWSNSARMLPTRPVAFTVWDSDTYVTFLQGQLQNARAYPNTLDAPAFAAINNAAIAVLTGVNTPADATQTIMENQRQ